MGTINGGNGAARVLEAPRESTDSPAVGVVVELAAGVTVKRLDDDGRGGGDWLLEHEGETIKTLRGLELAHCRDVVAAMAAEGAFDD